MSISDRIILPARLGNFVQSTYKHNIATLKQEVNFYFCRVAMLFLHVLEKKTPEFLAQGFRVQQIVDLLYNTNPLKSVHCGRPSNILAMGL